MNYLKHRKKIVLIIIVFIFMLAMVKPIYGETGEEWRDENKNYAERLIEASNDIRLKHGLEKLQTNKKLNEAATAKAMDMAQKSYFSHIAPDGKSPWSWLYESDYRPKMAGENLGLLYSRNMKLIDAWMESPGHRRNMLRENFEEIGIGAAEGIFEGKPMFFVVQFFGLE